MTLVGWLQGAFSGAAPHWIVAPILWPMATAIAMLALGERRRWHVALNVVSTSASLVLAVLLMLAVHKGGLPVAVGVYLPANWDVPFGIVLVIDRLAALMLVLTATVALGALLFAMARWDRAGVHFHPLFQLQLMGLNGVFLTGDVFNLFVCFEIMLAASYGLLLHGSGPRRVRSGLHYLAINLAASALFLVGVALLYGVTGTLNMADMAARIPGVPAADRGLLHAGAAVLAVAFMIKAAVWPLNFWLVPAYSSASAPVAALFSIMTKVGIYTLLRLKSLLFSEGAGDSAGFGAQVLLWGGLATVAYGAISMLSSQKVERLASFAVIVSSGSLLAAISFGEPGLTAGALYYLLSSTLGLAALFLLAELVERSRVTEATAEHAEARTLAFPYESLEPSRGFDGEEEDDEGALIGQPIPAAMAFLGLAFIACTLLVAGVPPLSGFVAKFAMLSALVNPLGLGVGIPAATSPAGWTLLGLLIVSGLFSLIALTGAGVRYFWAPSTRPAPALRLIECASITALLAACLVLTLRAEPVLRYARAAADALTVPSLYVEAVLSARPVPAPAAPDR